MTHSFFNSDNTSVKICGLTDEMHVDVAVGAGADAIGFIFVEESPRYISRELADRLLLQLPDYVLPVAVVKDYPTLSDFEDWPGMLQFCGSESVDEIQSAPCPVIKAFKWDMSTYNQWRNAPIEGVLIDGSDGGMGRPFNLNEVVQSLAPSRDGLIVAGGLNSSNVSNVISNIRPAAVDVSSGVEIQRGEKCPEKICDFINVVKSM